MGSRSVTLLIAVAMSVAVGAMPQDLSRTDADGMRKKLDVIDAREQEVVDAIAKKMPLPSNPLRTSFTEREFNAYLKYGAKDDVPAGIVNPQVSLLGEGRIAARATVDLDAVRQSRKRDLLSLVLTGSLDVTLRGVLHTGNGKATFDVESASAAGIPLPGSLLRELVAFYSKGPSYPQGIDLDKPFDLPHAIKSIEFQRDSATIIQ